MALCSFALGARGAYTIVYETVTTLHQGAARGTIRRSC